MRWGMIEVPTGPCALIFVCLLACLLSVEVSWEIGMAVEIGMGMDHV